jgi:hypothetical protein
MRPPIPREPEEGAIFNRVHFQAFPPSACGENQLTSSGQFADCVSHLEKSQSFLTAPKTRRFAA